MSCTVAVSHQNLVLAGYADGTFRIWKRISSHGPPSHHALSSAATLHGDDASFRSYGVACAFYCCRTLKLSDSGIADVMMTAGRAYVVVCDAMGLQFVVSVCWDGQQQHQQHEGFDLLSGMQTPFAFTDEPTAELHSSDLLKCNAPPAGDSPG